MNGEIKDLGLEPASNKMDVILFTVKKDVWAFIAYLERLYCSKN